MFAWATPSVYNRGIETFGVAFWIVDVQVNREAVECDRDWATPPVGFFLCAPPPTLLLGVIPFWENVNQELARTYGKELAWASTTESTVTAPYFVAAAGSE